MRDVSLWRALLGIEKTVIERVEFDEDAKLLVAQCVRRLVLGAVVGSAGGG